MTHAITTGEARKTEFLAPFRRHDTISPGGRGGRAAAVAADSIWKVARSEHMEKVVETGAMASRINICVGRNGAKAKAKEKEWHCAVPVDEPHSSCCELPSITDTVTWMVAVRAHWVVHVAILLGHESLIVEHSFIFNKESTNSEESKQP